MKGNFQADCEEVFKTLSLSRLLMFVDKFMADAAG
jgi:hypothetical protein